MISLTYLSTATEPFSPTDLSDLLSASRARNRAAGLTGMLLYVGGHFIQTLEGEDEAVDATFNRIMGDPRHRSVYVALREDLEARAFPDWSMGFETLPPDDLSTVPGFSDYLKGEPMSSEARKSLGHAGIFHRLFRDRGR